MSDSEEDMCLGDLKARAMKAGVLQAVAQPASSQGAAPTNANVIVNAASASQLQVAEDEDEEEEMSIGQMRAAKGLPVVAATAQIPAAPVPAPAQAPASPQFVHGFAMQGKYACLPGGFKLPKKLFESLYGYQRDGISWMWSLHPESPLAAGALGRGEDAAATNAAAPDMAAAAAAAAAQGPKISGGILADDMGLGKTLQVLSFITGCLHGEVAATALVLLPVSLIDTWQREFAKFAPNVAVHVLHDKATPAGRAKLVRKVQREGGVLLTTYGMVTFSPHLFGAAVVEEDEDDEEQEGGEAEEGEEGQGEQEADEEENDGFVRNKAQAQAKPAAAKPKSKAGKSGVAPPVQDCVWDIMVLDEGHKVKNPSTRVAKAVRAVPARMRLLLSGTPIQNNLDELWALFDFTACGRLLDTRRTFNSRIASRILKAREKKASAKARADGAQATAELMAIIGPYLLRREKEKLLAAKPVSASTVPAGAAQTAQAGQADVDELASQLTGMSLSAHPSTSSSHPSAATAMGVMGKKKEVVLWCPMAGPQTELYKAYLASGTVRMAMQRKRSREQGRSMLQAVTTLRLITSHPLLLGPQRLQELRKGEEEDEEQDGQGAGEAGTPAEDDQVPDGEELAEAEAAVEGQALAGWDATRLPSPAALVAESGKLRLAVLMLRLFAREGAKVLIFSQSVRMLDVLQVVVRRLYRLPEVTGLDGPLDAPAAPFTKGHSARMGDAVGKEEEGEGERGQAVGAGAGAATAGSSTHPAGLRFVRIDGGYAAADRAAAVRAFNTDPGIAVALISTGVGSLGLTLTAATRVVIFDPSWNPSVDAQAVDRAYRVGQTRDVVTYRFITAGTIEEKMYRQQVFKSGLNATVMAARAGTGSSMTALRFLSADDLRDLFKLGSTAYSATARIVDSVTTPPALPSAEIGAHLSSVALPPVCDAVVGVSHHDHLFRLQPESMAALAAAAKAEAANQRAKEKRFPGSTGDEEGEGETDEVVQGRLANMEHLRELAAAAQARDGQAGTADAAAGQLSGVQYIELDQSVAGAVAFVGHTGPLVHPGAEPLSLLSPVRKAPGAQAAVQATPRAVDVRLHFQYAQPSSSPGMGEAMLSPVQPATDTTMDGLEVEVEVQEPGAGGEVEGEGEGLLQQASSAELAPFDATYDQTFPSPSMPMTGSEEGQAQVQAEADQEGEGEDSEAEPVDLPVLSPERAESALGSARPKPARRSMGLIRPLEEEDDEEDTESEEGGVGRLALSSPASGLSALLPEVSVPAVTICDAHRTAAALSGLHCATRCECYALQTVAQAEGANADEAGPLSVVDASPDSSHSLRSAPAGLMDESVAPAHRLAQALAAIDRADADPRVHLAAMHAAMQMGLLGSESPDKENASGAECTLSPLVGGANRASMAGDGKLVSMLGHRPQMPAEEAEL